MLIKLFKYLIVAAIIYGILRMVPSISLSIRDIVLIITIVSLALVLLESNFFVREHMTEETKTEDYNVDGLIQLYNQQLQQRGLVEQKQETQPTQANQIGEVSGLPLDIVNMNTNKNEEQNVIQKSTCDYKVELVKKEMRDEIQSLRDQLMSATATPSGTVANRYLQSLIDDLLVTGMITREEVNKMLLKVKSKILTFDEAISALETLKLQGKGKTTTTQQQGDMAYNELPAAMMKPIGDKIANDWDNDYVILNTDKWTVPMARPPVCINTQPCTVCPSDSSAGMSLKDWDTARKVSDIKLNKAWTNAQSSA